jgi:Mg/Co/Ni transporter MgtE
MMSVGSLPGCDDALKIIKGISGTIIGCRRQPSIYLVIMPHFIFILTFGAFFLVMMPIFLWKLYRIGLFCFRMLSVGSNYS